MYTVFPYSFVLRIASKMVTTKENLKAEKIVDKIA